MKTFDLRIRMTVDDSVSEADAKDHVDVAVRRWGGSHHPDDVFFPSNMGPVIVTRNVKRRTAAQTPAGEGRTRSPCRKQTRAGL